MSFLSRRARLALGSSLLALLVLLGLIASELLFRYDWAYARLDDIEPRHARLQGLAALQDRIVAARDDAQAVLARHAWPAEASADRIGTDLQQRVRALAEAAGMGISNSQILPVRPGNGFELVPVSVSLDGTDEGLRKLLLALPAEQPSIQIESMAMQGGRRRANSPSYLVVQLTVSAMRLLP